MPAVTSNFNIAVEGVEVTVGGKGMRAATRRGLSATIPQLSKTLKI